MIGLSIDLNEMERNNKIKKFITVKGVCFDKVVELNQSFGGSVFSNFKVKKSLIRNL